MTQAEREKLWEARIAEYRASGQSVREWCANNNVRPHRLWYWLRKYKPLVEANNHLNQSGNDQNKAITWLPVEADKPVATTRNNTLVIQVGKTSIEISPGFDPELLSRVIRVLISLC